MELQNLAKETMKVVNVIWGQLLSSVENHFSSKIPLCPVTRTSTNRRSSATSRNSNYDLELLRIN